MATNVDHFDWSMVCYRMLKHRFRGRRKLLIAYDMLVIYRRGEDAVSLAPDVLVSFGVPPGPRASYSVRGEGKPPDVVLEFASPSTVKADAGKKKEKYRRMGVREYWLVDPVGGYHDPRVQGFQLVDGVYERLPWKEGSDGMVAVWSPVLQLEVRFVDGWLRFWDREKARYVELPEEEKERLQRGAEARLENEAEARQRAEARLENEAEARQRAEARLENEAEARQRAEARLENEAEARQRAEARLENEAEARQRSEARTRSAERALEAEKRARKALEESIAQSEAVSTSTSDPT